MSRIIRETLFQELAMIEAVDEQVNSPLQSMGATGKATGTTRQTSQVVPQLSYFACHELTHLPQIESLAGR